MMQPLPNLDPNPTPQFEQSCVFLKQAWIAGTLSVRDVMEQIERLSQDANAGNHIANQGRIEHIAGYIYQDMGDIARAIAHYDKAQRFYTRVGNRALMAIIDLNQGECYRDKGDFARALGLYQRAFDMAKEVNDVTTLVYAQTNLGWANFGLKEYAKAFAAFNEGLTMSETYYAAVENVDGTQSEIYYGLAMVELEYHQQPSKAWDNAIQALYKALDSVEMRPLGYAWRMLGDTLTQLGALPDGVDEILQLPLVPDEYYQRALSCFKEISAEVEMARTLFAQAKSLSHHGQRIKASPHYREAMIMFTRLGMTYDAMRVAEAQLRPNVKP